MERWVNKVAVINGASSGIGSAIVLQLVRSGMIVIGLARRLGHMENLKLKLLNEKGEFHPYSCDTKNLQSIKETFKEIENKFTNINVLINNAGIVRNTRLLTENNEDDLKSVIDTNLMGHVYCIKEGYKLMKSTDEESVIINIGSLAGYIHPFKLNPIYNIYPASKFGMRSVSEVLRLELLENPNIRISYISPGLVKTDISETGNIPYADKIMNRKAILTTENIAKSISFVLEMPKTVHISEMVIRPVGKHY